MADSANVNFVHIAKKETFSEALQKQYANSIVFIQESREIFTHGTFYSISVEQETKLKNLVDKVGSLKYFSSVSAGGTTAETTIPGGVLKFTSGGGTSVSINDNSVYISSPSVEEGDSIGTVKWNGTDITIKGVQTALNSIATVENNITQINSLTGSGAISVKKNSKGNLETISLNTTTDGNVKFSQTTRGLTGTVSLPVTGVSTDEKAISLTDGELSSTLSLNYDSEEKTLQILGINGAVISSIDASRFIKDGMLSSASFDPTTKDLTLTFNTDAGKDPITVSLSGLIGTVYNGKNVNLVDYTPVGAAGITTIKTNASVQDAVSELDKRTRYLQDKKLGSISASSNVTLLTLTASGGSITLGGTIVDDAGQVNSTRGLITSKATKEYVGSQINQAMTWTEL